jgi:CheY-like chemotaxis protein
MNRYKNILLVEDDEDDCEFFLEVLHEVDPEAVCTVAGNGAKALKLLKSLAELPELIVLDLNMPIMGGLEFLQRIRKEEAFKALPVIILTTSTKEADACYELGACIYIAKPTCTEVFVGILKKVLNRNVVKDAHKLQVLFAKHA